MLKMTDGDRAFFKEMRGLATDDKGNEILAGLTVEESQFYLALRTRTFADK
jgi:hypothetical protein